MKLAIFTTLVLTVALFSCNTMDKQKQSDTAAYPSSMYEYSGNIEPRWISFENRNCEKGKGGMENNGAKGHPSDMIHAGQILSLVDIAGPGIINRMWFTISDRSEYTLRGLVLKIYWDGEESRPFKYLSVIFSVSAWEKQRHFRMHCLPVRKAGRSIPSSRCLSKNTRRLRS